MSSHMNVSLEVISMVYQSLTASRHAGDADSRWLQDNEKTEEIFQTPVSVTSDHIPFEFPPPPKVPLAKCVARPLFASPHPCPSDSDSQSDSGKDVVRSSPIAIRSRPLEVCGGYQSDGSPVSYQKPHMLPPIGVFWDIENCQVPKGRSAIAIAQVIRDTFFIGFKEAEFLVVCDVTKESAQVVKDLNDAQVNLIHVSSTSKNAADEKLRQSIRRFADIHGSPAAIILISGDINFAADLNDLRHRKKIHVILLHNSNTSEALILCANEHYLFSSLAESVPPISNKRSDSPSELLISNLPEDQDLGRVKTRLKKLSDNCGGRVITISNTSATIRFSNFICASRAQKRMEGEDVYGRKISVGSPRRAQDRSEKEMSPSKSARKMRHNSRSENLGNYLRSPRRQRSCSNVMGGQSAVGGWSVAGSMPCFPSNPLDVSLRRIHPAVLQQVLFPSDARTQSVPADFRMPMWPLAPIGQLPSYQHSTASVIGCQKIAASLGSSSKTPEGMRRIRGRHGQVDEAALKEEERSVETSELLTQKSVLKRSRTASPILPAVRPISVPAVSGVPLPRKCRTPSPYTVYDSREKTSSALSHANIPEHYFHPISVPSNSPVPIAANSPIELTVTNLDQTFNSKELQNILLEEFKGHVMVLSLSLSTHSDGTVCAYVKVPSLQDAQFAISKLHRRRLGSKRMIISYANTNGPNPQVIRAQIVCLLRDVPGHCLPLFKFCEMYESRFLATISVADMYRMRDICLISDDSSGRMVRLNPELRNTPSPCLSDSSQGPNDQPIELPYCSLHPWRPNVDKGWAEQDFGVLPNVRIGLELLKTRIDVLLHSHQGRLPLPSLPTCYEAQFEHIEVDPTGVPLEHLISCLRGVEMYQGVGSAKYLCWAKSQQDVPFEDTANVSPPLASQLALFCRELVDLLKTSTHCQLPFNRFIPAYHHHFGRQCRVADYGFTKLVDLLDALPNTVQVMGEGSRRVITLSHRAQVRRFTTDVIRILKYSTTKQVTLEEFPAVYQRVMGKDWDVVGYGVCTIKDLLGEISESVICVNWGNEVTISMPKREQSPEEIERTKSFAGEVVELLRHAPQCSMLFSKFIPAYHQHFGHQCRLSDYGFIKLIELFEAISDVVRVEDGFTDGERRVSLTLGESLKVLSEQLVMLVRASPHLSVQLSALPVAYLRLYGHSLRPETYQCSSLRQLVDKFPEVLKMVSCDSDCFIVLVDQSDFHQLALQTRRVLMTSSNFCMTGREFLKIFWRIYKRAYDVERAKKELASVVKITDLGDDLVLELTPLQQFACGVYRLLFECKGSLKLLSFDFMYLRVFGVPYEPAAMGYPSIEAHLRAIPETVLLRGATRSSRTIILNKNLAIAGFPLPPQLLLLDNCDDLEMQGLELACQKALQLPETTKNVHQENETNAEACEDVGESARDTRLPQVLFQDVDSPISSPSKLWSPPTFSPVNHSFKVELPASLSEQPELLSPSSFLLPASPAPQVVPPHPSELPLPDPALLWGRTTATNSDVTDDSSPSKLANKRRIAAHFDML